jgi:hypothetical protein
MDCSRFILPKKILKLKMLHDECIDRLDDNLDIVNIIEMGERAKDIARMEKDEPPTDSKKDIDIHAKAKKFSKVKSYSGHIV